MTFKERKKVESDTNVKAARSQGELLHAELQLFLTAVDGFSIASDQCATRTQVLVTDYIQMESSTLSSHRLFIGEQMKRIDDSLRTLLEGEAASEHNLQSIWTIVKEVQGCLANELSSWSTRLESDIQTASLKIEESNAKGFSSVSPSLY